MEKGKKSPRRKCAHTYCIYIYKVERTTLKRGRKSNTRVEGHYNNIYSSSIVCSLPDVSFVSFFFSYRGVFFFTFFFCPSSACHRQRSDVKMLRSGEDFNFPRQRIFSIHSRERAHNTRPSYTCVHVHNYRVRCCRYIVISLRCRVAFP